MSYDLGGPAPTKTFAKGCGHPEFRLPWTVFVLCILTLAIGVAMPIVFGPMGLAVTMLALVVVPIMARGWSPNDAAWSIAIPRFRVSA